MIPESSDRCSASDPRRTLLRSALWRSVIVNQLPTVSLSHWGANMIIDIRQWEWAGERFRARVAQRTRNQALIAEGRPLAADAPERVGKFLERHGFSAAESRAILASPGSARPQVLERVLGMNDLVSVCFLQRGLAAAKAVGRIWIQSGNGLLGYGTGFMVSPRLLLTNHHVLGDRELARRSVVEFDYQRDNDGCVEPTTIFEFDAAAFHVANESLDYALVAVKPVSASGRRLSEYGYNPLIEQEGKAVAAQYVNIVQHPNGEPKQLVLRENQIVDVLEDFLHYLADTAQGSSGSAVFNDRWEVVALHHSGVPDTNEAGQILAVDGQVWQQAMGESNVRWKANEGVRISRIVKDLKQRTVGVQRDLLLSELAARPTGSSQSHTSTFGGESALVASMGQDGTATWTIPLTLSVNLGGAAMGRNVVPSTMVTTSTGTPSLPDITVADHQEVLESARRELGAYPGVLQVRLGYAFSEGRITNRRALVVTVVQKRTEPELERAGIAVLPKTYQGLPVQVTPPSVEELVRVERGPDLGEAALRVPGVRTEEILYQPPAGAELAPIDDEMRVVAHVSPDAGWNQLKEFLSACRESLTVGMYDFGAPHIVDALTALADRSRLRLRLVMQRGQSVGKGTKVDDLTDDEVVETLSEAFGDRFQNAWVKIGSVNGWVASSYHIKVAVRDCKAIWLSSGNWQSSNQPAIDPLSERPRQRTHLTKYNREWHAIVEHEGLARIYEAFLDNDLEQNLKLQPQEGLELPDLLVPDAVLLPALEARKRSTFEYFAPFDETRRFRVEPLLTPDNYHARVLELIRSAERELFIQNQTFNAPGDSHDQLRELTDAVLEKQQEGIDVRIIFRVLDSSKARQNLEALQELGFDMQAIKVQENCHTKGIIVDSQQVLLGSQNLSNHGVSVNRDASLLFTDRELARYFRAIFLHDWTNLARYQLRTEFALEIARAGEPTPQGMRRLTWKEYWEML